MPAKKTPKSGKAAPKKGYYLVGCKDLEGNIVEPEITTTDTIEQLKVAIQIALDEKARERSESQASGSEGDSRSATPAVPDGVPSLEERAAVLMVMFEGKELEDPEATMADLGIAKGCPNLELAQPPPQEGKGRFQFSTGAIYEGGWKLVNKKRTRHGKGTYSNGGETYVGDWFKDVIHGVGKYTMANGNTYEGQFNQACFHGKGKYSWVDGNWYDGQWENNRMSGTGCFGTASGDRYEGEFKNDKFINEHGHWLPPHRAYTFLKA